MHLHFVILRVNTAFHKASLGPNGAPVVYQSVNPEAAFPPLPCCRLANVDVLPRCQKSVGKRLNWGVRFAQPLLRGRLLRRWQRFLGEVELEEGGRVLAHVPNSGRLTGVAVPGNPVWLLPVNGGRLPFRLEIVEAQGVMVGVNTLRAGALAQEALRSGMLVLPDLLPGFLLRREVSPFTGVRLDFLLSDQRGDYWVEVKNVTLVEGGVGLFPDAVTSRGAKHLQVLTGFAQQGVRSAVVYVVQRGDANLVTAAASIDPTYARAMAAAFSAGVHFVAVACEVFPEAVVVSRILPVHVDLNFGG